MSSHSNIHWDINVYCTIVKVKNVLVLGERREGAKNNVTA